MKLRLIPRYSILIVGSRLWRCRVIFTCSRGEPYKRGERVQEGMVFLPEKKFSEDVSVASYNDKELEIEFRLKREFDQFRKGGSCDLKSTGKGNTSFIYSDECPLINDALFLAFIPI